MPSRPWIVKSLVMSENWGIFFTKSPKNSSDFDVPLGIFILTDLFYFFGEILAFKLAIIGLVSSSRILWIRHDR